MPPAKKSRSSTRRSVAFKEPAALKRLSKSLDAASTAMTELRKHTGRDVSKGARDVYKDVQGFVSNARRDTGKLAKALARDFQQAQKQVAASTGGARSTTSTARSRPKAATTRSRPKAATTRSRPKAAATKRARTSSAATRSRPRAAGGGRRKPAGRG
jgi:hypothetical protein